MVAIVSEVGARCAVVLVEAEAILVNVEDGDEHAQARKEQEGVGPEGTPAQVPVEQAARSALSTRATECSTSDNPLLTISLLSAAASSSGADFVQAVVNTSSAQKNMRYNVCLML